MFEKCDADNTAKATVRVEFPDGKELFFCGHHYQQNLTVLNDQFRKIEVRGGFLATTKSELLSV